MKTKPALYPKLAANTLEVLRRRYFLKDERKRVIETPDGLFSRVASAVAKAERSFGRTGRKEAGETFYRLMRSLVFLPNSPTLMNAGTDLGQLSACFVLPVEDSIEGIFDSLKDMASIHQSGGGTGFSFSNLRPKGDIVCSTSGEASGPVSFMSIYDRATGVIVQGGKRRGANMGILRVDHPDIVEFVTAKLWKDAFENFNLSVGITDKFMKAVRKGKRIALVNPRTRKRAGSVDAKELFGLIAECAWRTGDPGLVFIDEINRKNPTPRLGRIEATNPCGELPLLPYESCNLGSINISRLVDSGRMDWDAFSAAVKWGVRFLDNVIEINKYPIPEIGRISRANRKIGLGVMGFADALIKMGVPYGSRKSVELADRIMRFVREESIRASSVLARERGPFPNFKNSIYSRKGIRLRNATLNTIAPTGTISIIAGCSSGIEPLFAVSYMRNVMSGTRLFEVNPLFEEAAMKSGIYSKGLMDEIARRGSLRGIKGIPRDIKDVFVTAFDVSPEGHLRIQAAFQKHTDNSVSKTINLPAKASVGEIKRIYVKAHEYRCKGITVYRYGAKKEQVLSFGAPPAGKAPVTAGAEYSGGCAAGTCVF